MFLILLRNEFSNRQPRPGSDLKRSKLGSDHDSSRSDPMNISEPNTMYKRIPCVTMYQNDEIDNKITQLRKGILELAILTALYLRTHYGYSLVRDLTAAGALDLKEGTIYPILSRLAKEGLVRTEWVESNQGPPRKYYALTDAGRAMCEALNREFRRLVGLVDAAGQDIAAAPEAQATKKIIIGNPDHE